MLARTVDKAPLATKRGRLKYSLRSWTSDEPEIKETWASSMGAMAQVAASLTNEVTPVTSGELEIVNPAISAQFVSIV